MTSDQDALNRAYRERNELAAALAHKFQSSVGFDREAPGWPVLYIQLPTGQVSYHFSPADTDLLCGQFIAADDSVWDGHTPEDRSERIMRYLRGEGRGSYLVNKGQEPPITLEALLAYCREREWMWVISGGGNWNHCVTICADGKDLAFEAVKGRANPLTALVRAVLAAHEQEKAG